ncbi:hypothetical protein [Neoaquamicrobium sediminum]|uniref:Uncharacterized protein n=1 Tax=Neoaquamicrobium sediminum TaxID=1849104 RepID=A0ABV3WYQ3_9HYPH
MHVADAERAIDPTDDVAEAQWLGAGRHGRVPFTSMSWSSPGAVSMGHV